jgi:DNA repair protein RecO (recombination protein O)
MRTAREEGIIIKRRNVGEADRILTVFTRSSGKIRIKAPGVRRITSRRSSHIEPLNLSILNLYISSRSQIPILTEAQTIYDFDMLKKDLKKIGPAFYICELIDKLCPDGQENRSIFYLLKETLEKIEASEKSEILEEFEEKILQVLGFTPQKFFIGDRQKFIENILERRLTTRGILPLLIS